MLPLTFASFIGTAPLPNWACKFWPIKECLATCNPKSSEIEPDIVLALTWACASEGIVTRSDPFTEESSIPSLPSRVNPNIVACSFIMSGLRVFDIRNVKRPREVAYFNKPEMPGASKVPNQVASFAMSAPAYDEVTHDIWYTDGHSGFYVVRLTKATGISAFASRVVLPGN